MRKNQAKKREVLPDPIYNSKLVTKVINMLMWDGRRGQAQNILYGAFELIEQKTKKPAMEVFNKALENIEPTLELKVRRVARCMNIVIFLIWRIDIIWTAILCCLVIHIKQRSITKSSFAAR